MSGKVISENILIENLEITASNTKGPKSFDALKPLNNRNPDHKGISYRKNLRFRYCSLL